MSKTKEVGKRQRLSSVLDIGARRITITILSPDVGETHLTITGTGYVIENPKKVSRPVQVSGVLVPSTFLVEGFRDNGIPSSFILTLDVNKDRKTNASRSVHVTKIEADGDGGYLSAGLLKDIALDSVRDECLRMAAIRLWLYPEGEWDMYTHEEKTKVSTACIKVKPNDAPEADLFMVDVGARAKNAREWALTTSGKKPRAWDSDEVLKAVARLYAECPPIRNRALWIATRLDEEGLVNTRGTPYTPQSVNSQIREARARKFIKTTTRKKATK